MPFYFWEIAFMYVLYGKAELFIPYASSLKDKRQIIQSVANRLRNRFSLSVAEVEHHDLWQRSGIGFAAACKSVAEAELILDAVDKTLDSYHDQCEVTSITWEIIDA